MVFNPDNSFEHMLVTDLSAVNPPPEKPDTDFDWQKMRRVAVAEDMIADMSLARGKYHLLYHKLVEMGFTKEELNKHLDGSERIGTQKVKQVQARQSEQGKDMWHGNQLPPDYI